MGKNGGGGGGATKAFQRRKRSKYEDKDGIFLKRMKPARPKPKKVPKAERDKRWQDEMRWKKILENPHNLPNYPTKPKFDPDNMNKLGKREILRDPSDGKLKVWQWKDTREHTRYPISPWNPDVGWMPK